MHTRKRPAATKPRGRVGGGTTVDDVRAIALALQDTEERPSYGTPGFRVNDRLFARVLGDAALVVRADLAWRDDLVAGSPEIFYLTPHYEPHPWVVVRLAAIGESQLREVLEEARRLAAAERRASKPRARR